MLMFRARLGCGCILPDTLDLGRDTAQGFGSLLLGNSSSTGNGFILWGMERCLDGGSEGVDGDERDVVDGEAARGEEASQGDDDEAAVEAEGEIGDADQPGGRAVVGGWHGVSLP